MRNEHYARDWLTVEHRVNDGFIVSGTDQTGHYVWRRFIGYTEDEALDICAEMWGIPR